MPFRSWIVVLVCIAAASPCFAADTYVSARADSGGSLRIQRAKGPGIVVTRDREQVGFDKVAISKDGRSVGWLALYENCCTSYPIPLKLTVYSAGRSRTFEGNRLPIWYWQFTPDGRRVSFEQETVHGGLGVHYELREVATGRLVAQYDPQVTEEDRRSLAEDAPAWVSQLDASR